VGVQARVASLESHFDDGHCKADTVFPFTECHYTQLVLSKLIRAINKTILRFTENHDEFATSASDIFGAMPSLDQSSFVLHSAPTMSFPSNPLLTAAFTVST
jgi:hypothetical protein